MAKKRKPSLYEMIFLLPGLTIYWVFLVIPIGLCFFYSITNWNGISNHYKLIGLRNFVNLFSDISFLDAVVTTLLITIITTVLVNVFGILLAVFIESLTPMTSGFCKTAVFFPATLSAVIVAYIWAYMTQTDGGLINLVLDIFRLPGIDFYESELSMTIMVSVVISWAAVGFYTTVYMANLKSIAPELYEAARIDGANRFRLFYHITLPQLAPAITINTVLAMIWGLKQYDFVIIMVPGIVQTITVNAVERAFEYNMLGYSSAIVLYLFIFILGLSFLQMRILKRIEV